MKYNVNGSWLVGLGNCTNWTPCSAGSTTMTYDDIEDETAFSPCILRKKARQATTDPSISRGFLCCDKETLVRNLGPTATGFVGCTSSLMPARSAGWSSASKTLITFIATYVLPFHFYQTFKLPNSSGLRFLFPRFAARTSWVIATFEKQ
jgi:hypothetical protein